MSRLFAAIGKWWTPFGWARLFLGLGVIELVGSIAGHGVPNPAAGITVILGALACLSATGRRVRGGAHSRVRIGAEVFLVLLMLYAAFGQNDLKVRMATDPVPFANAVIGFIAYLVAFFRASFGRPSFFQST